MQQRRVGVSVLAKYFDGQQDDQTLLAASTTQEV